MTNMADLLVQAAKRATIAKGMILMKRALVNMALVLVAAAVAGLGVASVTVGTTLSASAANAPGEAGSAALASARYRVTDDVQAARDACYRAEEYRIEQEHAVYIPNDEGLYIEWYKRGGPAVTAWDQALSNCFHSHTQPGGMWNWDAMIFVGYR